MPLVTQFSVSFHLRECLREVGYDDDAHQKSTHLRQISADYSLGKNKPALVNAIAFLLGFSSVSERAVFRIAHLENGFS